MRFTCVFASVKKAFAFSLVSRQSICVLHVFLNRFETAFAFFLVLHHNACVSNACLHRLRRLLRFPWYGVTMHAFHGLVFI